MIRIFSAVEKAFDQETVQETLHLAQRFLIMNIRIGRMTWNAVNRGNFPVFDRFNDEKA